jgi:TonB family protein
MPSSAIFTFLAAAAVRSLVLFLVVGLAVAVLRVRSAAARHAAWTAVLFGMLLLPALGPVLPALPLRILKPAPSPRLTLPEVTAVVTGLASPAAPSPRLPRFTWEDAAAAAYALAALFFLGRLFVSWLFTRRLLRAVEPIEGNLHESAWISVPMTAGRRILLPAGWREWDAAKLDAVLAHERSHLERADWAVGLAAAVNRSIFWFHPLAWWLERRLASLAEEACDDAALRTVSPAPYAQALLDMAAAVKTAQGRLMWEAMAMAKAAEVQKRIERALDDSREIPQPFTARRRAALAACALPIVWLAAVAQLVPATAQQTATVSAAEVAAVEREVAANPNDIGARLKLVLTYYGANVREPRVAQIDWMISNHPEAGETLFASRGLTAHDSTLNSRADFDRAAGLWRQALSAHPEDPRIVRNTAEFFSNAGQYNDAEQILLEAQRLNPGNTSYNLQLGRLYATAILAATSDPKFPNGDAVFAGRAQSTLESSDSRPMVSNAAMVLATVARRPQPGETLPQGVLNLDDHPQLVPAVELGHRLMDRMGMPFAQVVTGGATAGGRKGTSGAIGGIVGSAPSPAAAAQSSVGQLPQAPPVVERIAPVYPPLALQARISGIVTMKVTIAANGTVQHIDVVSGHPLLVPAALEALRGWKFQPQAAEGTYRVDIPFTPGNSAAAAEQAEGKVLTVAIGGNVQAAKLLHRVDPAYPPEARAAGVEGSVTLKVLIDENGNIASVEPTDGNPALALAAMKAVREWTYQPTLLNGKPVRVSTTVIVPFTR